ncbi:MAG: protein rep [Planctomycetota bacterium]
MSEASARNILPHPTEASDARRASPLASAARFRAHADDVEDRVRERITTNQGHRLNEAHAAAERAAEGRELAPANPASADRQPPAQVHASYLILVPNSSTPEKIREFEQEIDLLPQRLERAGESKKRTNRMGRYLLASDNADHWPVGEKLISCNTYRVVRHWLETGDARLIAAKSCRQDKLCPVCANLRAGRTASRYENRILSVLAEQPKYTEWLWTFTVVDGDDLGERLNHLASTLRLMLDHRRKYRSGTSRHEFMPFCTVAGGVYSIEIVIGKGSGKWHPHVHAYALCDGEPERDQQGRCREMEDWWYKRTGDSFIVDVRPVDTAERGGAVMEVLKYTTKFSNLALDLNVHAWETARGQRLRSAFGCLYGVPDVKRLTDDLSDDEGAYLDLAFRHDGERYIRDFTGEGVA